MWFVRSWRNIVSGRTPIPCSLCNNHLKFDQLLIVAQQIGAERVATGHYARVTFDDARGRWLLKRPADASKDQTYFLFGLTQEQLSRTIFPLGDMTKPEVRELARGITGSRWRRSPTLRRFALFPVETTSASSMLILPSRAKHCRKQLANLLRPTAKLSVSTAAFTTSPSASARDSALLRVRRYTSSRSAARTSKLLWAEKSIFTRAPCAPDA